MKLKLLALLGFALAMPAVAQAQAETLKAGTWTGTVTPPDGDPTDVTYDVTVKGDSITIVIHAGEHGDFTTDEARYADGKIMFRFTPGPEVKCTLTRDDKGHFSGTCVEDDGSIAEITMVPPSQ